MSRSENSRPNDTKDGLRAVERFWQASPPGAFCSLYTHFQHPFLAPCEFLALEAIAGGTGRAYGQIPQFMPFGRSVGEGGLYGFYVTPETALGRWPVLYWDEDEMYLRPVASDFEAFLRYCVLVGRYETEEQWPEEVRDRDEAAARRLFARRLGLPGEMLTGPMPRNDSELYERLVASDPQDAVSLCRVGCARRAQGNSERALDFFHRAGEAAPWFGDPYYLLADTYRLRGSRERAVQGWWAVVQCLLPLCTRTWEWDLGEEHPEADIYEVAADALAQFGGTAASAVKSSALWRVVVQDDPYDPDVREALGDTLLSRNDFVGAEREYLNALSLCGSERGRQPDRLYEALTTLYDRTGRMRDAAFVRHDGVLPRSNL
jgi:hypothetical protein